MEELKLLAHGHTDYGHSSWHEVPLPVREAAAQLGSSSCWGPGFEVISGGFDE